MNTNRREFEEKLQPILQLSQTIGVAFRNFVHFEATGSILLLVASLTALIWANSRWSHSYFELLHMLTSVRIGGNMLELSLEEIVNDGLMAVFFLVVGLEVKREVMVGELSSKEKAALPVAAAIGGMLAPALVFLLFNAGGPGAAGWGVPMATDIAFALGILALLGSRVPPALKVFLTALAVADDIGAALVIALFYTSEIAWGALLAAAVLLFILFLVGRMAVLRTGINLLLMFLIWLAVLLSGVHATLAGILIALTIPVRARLDPKEFLAIGYSRLEALEGQPLTRESMIHDREQYEVIAELHRAARTFRPMGLAVEEYFHPLLVFFILPVFAFMNAGVPLPEDLGAVLKSPLALGIFLGLVVGKQAGITLFSWLTVKSGLASLPEGVSWRQIYGVSWLGGIGFTMSLFITRLAFDDPVLMDVARIAILAASLTAGVAGYFILRAGLKDRAQTG